MDLEKLKADQWLWVIEMAIGLAIILVLSFALRKAVYLVHQQMAKKSGFWKKKVHKILHMPLQLAIWGFGLTYIFELVANHFGLDAFTNLGKVRVAFIVACFSWVALRWVKEGFQHLAQKSEKMGVAPGTIHALGKLASFVVSILSIMLIFTVFGLDVAPLITFGGIGAAGFAFAAKDIISNFFGGAMLHFTRVFSIGDMIVIPSRDNFEGIVKEIGWYATMVEDYYRRPVYFPNALFSNSHVINESRRSHRRIKGTITVRYEDIANIEKIVEELKEKIGAHPDIDDSQSFSISFMGFGDHGLEIFYYLLSLETGYIRFLVVKQQVLLIMSEVVAKYGAEFCYPTTTVHLNQMPLKP